MTKTGSGLGTGLTVATLLGLVAACTAVAVYLWTSMEGVEMSGHGWSKVPWMFATVQSNGQTVWSLILIRFC